MTPMIDIIFQLIIFFMCTVQFKSVGQTFRTFPPLDEGEMWTKKSRPAEQGEVIIKLGYNAANPLVPNIVIDGHQVSDWEHSFMPG